MGREIIKRHEQPLPDDVEAAWAEWSRNLPGADARGVALLRAAFDTGVKVGRLESKKIASNLPSVKAKPSALVDTRIIYCGDNLDQLAKLPDRCVDLIYIDPPFNSNRNYEVFWGETREKRSFEDRHESTQAYIEFMRPAMRGIASRTERHREFLLPLRLARQPLRQGDAGSDFRGESISHRDNLA